MHEPIETHILKTREERRAHLDLTTPCVKIGGYDSREYRGLLAHHLRTTIPTGNKRIVLAHACNQAGCSNPAHLYWATRADNIQDTMEAKASGTWSSPEQIKVKYKRKPKINTPVV